MKKLAIVVIATFATIGQIQAQAFKGKGDVKGQVGVNFQSGGTGITVSSDFGIGENMSYGFVAGYLLSVEEVLGSKAGFSDRVDLKARFNANIGSVLKLNPKIDVYPGLDLSLKNFGGHVGARYFFTDGFGVYSEAAFPIARYNNSATGFDYYNNQFNFQVGISFNL
ncbi:DUF6646 domain-containing protein [Flavobacterium branchiophilum]|uniref:Probable outer membrane protein, OmpA family n=1 Tax=Flavobacterium branchiophilum (strain FL-15) TaxID=1034807 RepID=G2Z6B4_FLABF|nr:DUF6646 family protein [Flavobacterium branchiophilum]CCB70934.1 Probable outer membrane protein precursor, OmpA family [Flavobacterium branchiophilum FL-15]